MACIVLEGPESNDKHPYKRKAEGDLRQSEVVDSRGGV